jgi:hypothetical protein
MSTGYVLGNLPKAVRFDHIKGIDDSRTKEQRYESLQAIWDNRIIDDLNDIAVLVTNSIYKY